MSSLTAQTRLFTVLGDPVDHSLSPVIQNAAFLEAGVDGVYVAFRCDADGMVGFMSGLGRAGGGGNVTLPHKEKGRFRPGRTLGGGPSDGGMQHVLG